jgi:tRNA(Ile)-lysidine synthase
MHRAWRLGRNVARCLPRLPPLRKHKKVTIAIAVSGGVDSVALFYLARNLGQLPFANQDVGRRLYAVTVDHRFRPESRHELQFVQKKISLFPFAAHLATELNPENSVRTHTSKLQNWAREKRYLSINQVCGENHADIICTGHHNDDHLETFAMRFFRGSGLHGLRGIDLLHQLTQKNRLRGFLARPIINYKKKELYDLCNTQNITYVEDPSNCNTDYDRVRSRNGLSFVNKENICKLLQLSSEMVHHGEKLHEQLIDMAIDVFTHKHSYVVIDTNALLAKSENNNFLGKLALALILQQFSGGKYPPSRHAVASLYKSIKLDLNLNPIQRCVFTRNKGFVYVYRSPPVHSEKHKVLGLCRSRHLFETKGLLNNDPFSYSIAINASQPENYLFFNFGVGFWKNESKPIAYHKWPKVERHRKLRALPCVFTSSQKSRTWSAYVCPHEELFFSQLL